MLVWAKTESFEDGEYATLSVGPVGSLTEVQRWENGDDEYHPYPFDLSIFDAGGTFRLQFESHMSGNNDHLYVDDLLISGTPAFGGPTPTPVSSEGQLYVVDVSENVVYRYGTSGAFVESFALVNANKDGRGITVEGNGILVVDKNDKKVYKYDTSGFSLGEFDLASANGDARGMASYEGAVLVVDKADATVYEYDAEGAPLGSFELVSETSNAGIVSAGGPRTGDYHLRIRGSTGFAKRAADLSGQYGIRLQFWAKVDSFEPGDEAGLQVSPDGVTWTSAKTWTSADSDNTYHFVDVDLSSYDVSSEFWVGFVASMSAGNDRLFVDDLRLVRPSPGAILGLPSDGFESGDFSGGEGWLSDWTTTGNASVVVDGVPHVGTYHLRMRKGNSYVERPANLTGHSSLRLQFWAKADSMEGGDYVEALVSDDHSDWTSVKTWTSADSDNAYHFADIDLSPYTMSSEFWIAFDSGMNNIDDRFYVDDLRLVGPIAYEIIVNAGKVTTKAVVTVQDGEVSILSWERD